MDRCCDVARDWMETVHQGFDLPHHGGQQELLETAAGGEFVEFR